ncbi:MAG: restriction endonuclease [Bacteroidales bacterium]|nr:restriction endonuclease [Bacteroidales bacterium]
MKILVEGYYYDPAILEREQVTDGLIEYHRRISDGFVCYNYVGHVYSPKLKDYIFFLPKVVLEEKEKGGGDKVFGENPEDIISISDKDCKLDIIKRGFVSELAVWIYKALMIYRETHPDQDVLLERNIAQIGNRRRRLSDTLLDIILELIRFNRDNQDFVLYVLKNIHSGYNKIDWRKTITHSQAIIQNGAPIYLRIVNRKKQVNFDEELFVIYYSILNYIAEHYGFRVYINLGFELITGTKFKHYIAGYGRIRMRQIKYKYFSDKALRLWELCFAFFDKSHAINIHDDQKEYLLAQNFYIVFEAIIDELLGDKKDDLPEDFKDQKDGKLVDHLYTYPGLIEADEEQRTYYIGDSKYYKIGSALGDTSIYKQYTYARNIIQYNIDLWLDDEKQNPEVKLRDDATEGYNIIPNFFISAAMKKDDFSYNHREIEPTQIVGRNNPEIKFQFKDRLFDRDTMLLSRYNVNFLFVISLYARNRHTEKALWKEEVRRQFRKEIRNVLKEKYVFFAMKAKGNPLAGEEFIKEHFKELQGKLYRPYGDKNIYSLALEKHKGMKNENSDAYHLLEEFFEIEPVDLGENPKQKLDEKVETYQTTHPYTPTPENWLPEYHVERYLNDCFVVGLYHDQEHWNWITGKNNKGALIYNVRLDKNRAGSMPKSHIRALRPKFAILYEEGHETENKYHVFRIHDFAVMTEERMRRALYPGEPQGDYFIFRFDEEVTLGNIDVARLINDWRNEHPDEEVGAPIFMKGEDVLKYRDNSYR